MTPPFTVEQFLGVFAGYNAAIWPAQIVAYVSGLVGLATVWSRWPIAPRLILSILALMWALNGVGYHLLFFTAINPAAKLFAALFVLQAILSAVSALANKDLRFDTGRSFRSIAGFAAIAYAMLIYPILGLWAGHGLLDGPMFGVAPCPTTIFTVGMLLLARGRWIVWLSIIPMLWSVVGLAAAVQLAIPEDFGLPVAGFVLLLVLANQLILKRFCMRTRSSFGTVRP